ncbi:MAG: type II toxin-antitoxin system RelE/ParE family toxin [Flavobacteriia bacterium]
MEIVWTHTAIRNLKKIHKFYCKVASKEIADKVLEPIFSFIKSLKHSQEIGQAENCLKPLKQKHRYLVYEHFKIIYVFKSDIIYITHVFDTRQNPKKLK